MGQPLEAVQGFVRAIALRPNYWEARYALGEELAFAGKLPEAQAQFEEVIHLKPDYAMAHLNLGVALAKEGHLEDAVKEFQETKRLDPQNKLAGDYLERMKLAEKSRGPATNTPASKPETPNPKSEPN